MIRCQHCNAENADDARFCGSCGRATSATEPTGGARVGTPAPDMVGREIAGRYRVLAKIGEGGMGAVYRGEQMSLKRKVAIKLLHPELSADAGLLRRFNVEAELVAKLGHPNTVNIYDFGQDADGTLFIAMEYLEGKSLRQELASGGPMPPRRALHIATQVASSIADAHTHGIVHRDLKPDNVMLTERGRARDIVRVLDFGIAKLRDEQNKVAATNPMTRAGDMVGTPQYMAPEQIRGEEVDGRTDVYALGAILYEMLTGRLVFEGPSLMAILSRHLLDTPEPPTRRRPDLNLPPALDGLVLEMLSKDPRTRLASMDVASERIAAAAMQVGDTGSYPGVGGGAYQPGTPTPSTGPGAMLMRPPGVPSTYPPGMMRAPPPGTPPGAPGARHPATPPPQAMVPTQQVGQPMHPMQPRPMPMPMPMPMPQAQPQAMHMPMQPRPMPMQARRGTPVWLWIVIGAAVLALAVIATAVSMHNKKQEAAEDRSVGGGGSSASRSGPILDGQTVTAGSYQVRLPFGFVETPSAIPSGDGLETHAYSGTLGDGYVTIVLIAAAEDLTYQAHADLESGCEQLGTNFFGGGVRDSRMVTGHGAQRFRCTVGGAVQTAEAALYSGPAGSLIVFFSTIGSAFDGLSAARDDLFDQRVEHAGG